MMGSFITRGLSMVLGYAYPAYECFKTVEKNKPEIEQLRFWCQYWILVAVLTVFERFGDAFISWLPMYSEAKLAFFVYLWYPKTRGTTYVYDTFLRPYVAKHETEIDRNLLELRTRAGDIAVLYWQKAASYGQTRIFEVLQYVASQSPTPHPAQQQQRRQAGVRQPPPPTAAVQLATQQPPQPAAATRQPATQQPPQPPVRPPASTAAATHEREPAKAVPSPADPAVPSTSNTQTTAPSEAAPQTNDHLPPQSEGEAMQVDTALVLSNGGVDPPPQETVMEEIIRVTRGRLRRGRTTTNPRQ